MAKKKIQYNEPCEVIVVGSGAGGGMMAYQLATSGVQVVLLESGRNYDPSEETAMFNLNSEAPLRNTGTPDKPAGFYDATIGGDQLEEEPYTTDEDSAFRWWRGRMMGGRTQHWGRQTPRYGPDDFKVFSNTGREVDWPVSYDDMSPYYDQVETIVGVLGPDEKDAVHNSPVPPNHIRHKPPAPRASEMLFAKACAEIGHKTHAHPTAILTRNQGNRSACFYATNCIRGCSTGAAFDSVTGFIKPALETGNLTVVPHAHVLKVLTDDTGKTAKGVHYIDRLTDTQKKICAKVVVLAAGSVQSCRIMLNSATNKTPDGLGNSSGLLGKYLSDTLYTSLFVHLPSFTDLPPHNEDGISQPHLYAPGQLSEKEKREKGLDFSGSYKLEVAPYGGGRFGLPGINDAVNPLLMFSKGLYGKKLKQHMRKYYGSLIGLRSFGSMSLNENCSIRLDPIVKDKWGMPAARFHWALTDEDFRRVEYMNSLLHKVAKKMGAKIMVDSFSASREAGKLVGYRGGSVNHETGGCRMGNDPKTSVLNAHSCSWDVPNLYVADAAPFVNHTEKNPTLTIMALSMRAADNIIGRLKENDL